MNITLLTIGRMKKNSPEFNIIAGYVKQCKWPITIKEFEEKRPLKPEELKNAESQLLLKAIPPRAVIIVMDEKGQQMTSREFSQYLVDCQNRNITDIVFLIGGANGHSDILKKKATLLLSMGKMTLPHMLARTVLIEQLFRACSIAHHHPYHRD